MPQVFGFNDKDIVGFFTYLIHDLHGDEMCCDSSGEVSFDCRSYLQDSLTPSPRVGTLKIIFHIPRNLYLRKCLQARK